MAHPLVVHCKRSACDVYIGRPSKWGNPFVIGSHGPGVEFVATREEAVALYKIWIQKHPEKMAAAKRELKGKTLGCYCAPKLCHGDVLAEIANS